MTFAIAIPFQRLWILSNGNEKLNSHHKNINMKYVFVLRIFKT